MYDDEEVIVIVRKGVVVVVLMGVVVLMRVVVVVAQGVGHLEEVPLSMKRMTKQTSITSITIINEKYYYNRCVHWMLFRMWL